jgi:ABC-type antimicrobial peptide transport system permease subunit
VGGWAVCFLLGRVKPSASWDAMVGSQLDLWVAAWLPAGLEDLLI